MNLRRTLARLVGDRSSESAPVDSQPQPATDPPPEEAKPVDPSSGKLSITFTMVERPRDES
jgi:hypothetical protein